MPRRKKHKKIGATKKKSSKKNDFMPLLLGIVGAVGAKLLHNIPAIKNSTNANMPKFVAGGELALGLLLPMFVKNDLIKGLSLGVGVGGGVNLLDEMGVISGIIPSISGYTDMKAINGMPPQLNNFLPAAAQSPETNRTLTASQIIGSIMMSGNQDN